MTNDHPLNGSLAAVSQALHETPKILSLFPGVSEGPLPHQAFLEQPNSIPASVCVLQEKGDCHKVLQHMGSPVSTLQDRLTLALPVYLELEGPGD